MLGILVCATPVSNTIESPVVIKESEAPCVDGVLGFWDNSQVGDKST